MSNKSTSKNYRRANNKISSNLKSIAHQGPSLFAKIISCSNFIPPHTTNPRVTRIIRIYSFLTSASPVLNIAYGALGQQDYQDYGMLTFRYRFMRVKQVKAWLEVPNGLSVAVQIPTLVLTETATGFRTTDRGIAGSRYAKTGLTFSWSVQQAVVATNSGTSIFQISTDVTIPASTFVPITMDIVCEFL